MPWIWTGIAAATVILMFAMAPFTALLPRVVQSHYHRGVGAYGLALQRDGGRDGGGLARLGAAGIRAGSRVAICFAAFGINDLGIVVLALSPWYRARRLVAVVWRGFWIGIGISAWMTLITRARARAPALACVSASTSSARSA